MTRIEMPGLDVGPMGAWLAAVGALRMASRADPAWRLHWDGGTPVLTGPSPVLARDLADRAHFTPVITPWQSGGGWGAKDKTSAERLARLRASQSPRLEAMRRSIAAADAILLRHRDADKDTLVRLLRNTLPDEAVPWLDAAVPLRSERGQAGAATVAFAPLAGTGGNDARWDLSTNYHAAILHLRPEREPRPDGSTGDYLVARRRVWLEDLLDGTDHYPLVELSSGPYWPAATQARLANPWAIVLMTEGLCGFGDAPVREYEVREQPWTTAAGPELDRDQALGEAWLPMWDQALSISEAALLLGGPQPRWRGRAALAPAQMYAALRAGAWPPGVTGFARYGLARRRGHAHIAVPLDAVTTSTVPAEEWLQGKDAARRAGVGWSTWRGYVTAGRAPQPDRRNPVTGHAEWAATTVDAWRPARPGQGVRTDLHSPGRTASPPPPATSRGADTEQEL